MPQLTILENATWANLISTTITGIIVAYIAIRQHILDKNKFRLSLYERRLNSYRSLSRFISEVLAIGNLPMNDPKIMEPFLDAWRESPFLFGDKISEYFDKIYANGLQLVQFEMKIRIGHVSPENSEKLADEKMKF